MNVDPAYVVLGRQARLRVVVELLAGDDVHVPPGFCQMEGERGENLAGSGMIGPKISIEKEKALHRDNATLF